MTDGLSLTPIPGRAGGSRDQEAGLGRGPSELEEEEPEDRKAADPGPLQDARRRGEARACGAILQAAGMTLAVRAATAAGQRSGAAPPAASGRSEVTASARAAMVTGR